MLGSVYVGGWDRTMSQCAFCVESAGLEVNIVCEQVFDSKDFVTSVRVHHKHTKITAATSHNVVKWTRLVSGSPPSLQLLTVQ